MKTKPKYLGVYLEEAIVVQLDDIVQDEMEVKGYEVSRNQIIIRALREYIRNYYKEESACMK